VIMKRLNVFRRRDAFSLNPSTNVYSPDDSDSPFRLIFGLE
jgi:hypothetical protein